MTTFHVLLHPGAVRFLERLPKGDADRVKRRLREAACHPFHYLEHYEGADYYKLRVGPYRALIDVDQRRQILFVRVLDKRSRVYKR